MVHTVLAYVLVGAFFTAIFACITHKNLNTFKALTITALWPILGFIWSCYMLCIGFMVIGDQIEEIMKDILDIKE